MARCFAYTPPNFGMEALERVEPLVDPIKKHRKKAEESKNEKKREKKGRRSERNHKKREHKEEGSQVEGKDEHCARRNKDGTEQSEKSGLTAEHGMPCSIPDPVDDSSDSIQNSSAKRRKLDEPAVVHKNRGGGFIFRFRLSTRGNEDSPCVTKRIAEPAAAEMARSETSPKRIDDWKIKRGVGEVEQNCITKRIVEPSCKRIDDSDRRIRRQVGEVKKLNRSPPPFSPSPLECQEFDDQDWLFVTKPPLLSVKRCVAGIQDHGSSVCSFLQHQAGIDMFALPYVVPF